MSDDNEQHPIEKEITRREAMEKIGKYGVFVPATLAVLTTAPRAFAQSNGSVLRINGSLRCNMSPVNPFQLGLALGDPANEPSQIQYTDSIGGFEFSLDVPVGSSDTWYIIDTLGGGGTITSGNYPPLTHALGVVQFCPD